MAGLKQSKRVSWPTDGNLFEVRLFLSEDAPCQSGLGDQDHLQAKAAWLLHAAGLAESEDSLPPGFEASQKYRPKTEISQIPIIKWQCPPSLLLNPEWWVVAGEESEELDVENRRLLGMLEAVYPRLSSIPQNPSVAPEVQATHMDDSCTPLIPITPIEDDGTDQDTVTPANNAPIQSHSLPNAGTPWNSTFEQLNSQLNAATSMPNLPHLEQPPSSLAMPTSGPAPTAEPDVLAAASAAFTAIMRSSEKGSLIDRDLLIKILSNPVMVENLVSEYGAPKQTPPLPMVNTSAAPSLQPVVNAAAVSSNHPVVNTAAIPSRQLLVTAPVASTPRPPPQIALSAPSSAPPISHMFHAPSTVLPTALHPHHTSRPMPIAPPTQAPGHLIKDANYYKSLIQLHGGDKPDTSDQNPMLFSNLGNPPDYHHNMSSMSSGGDQIGVRGLNQRDLKPKVLKPCAYFNTPRGCRHGSSCLFQHDTSSIPQRIEHHKGTTKRIKLDKRDCW